MAVELQNIEKIEIFMREMYQINQTTDYILGTYIIDIEDHPVHNYGSVYFVVRTMM